MIDNRHFAKAVALLQRSEQVLPSAPGFQHCDLAGFEDEHRIGLVAFAEEELIHRDGYDGAQAEHKFEDVGPDSATGIRCRSSIRNSFMAALPEWPPL